MQHVGRTTNSYNTTTKPKKRKDKTIDNHHFTTISTIMGGLPQIHSINDNRGKFKFERYIRFIGNVLAISTNNQWFHKPTQNNKRISQFV